MHWPPPRCVYVLFLCLFIDSYYVCFYIFNLYSGLYNNTRSIHQSFDTNWPSVQSQHYTHIQYIHTQTCLMKSKDVWTWNSTHFWLPCCTDALNVDIGWMSEDQCVGWNASCRLKQPSYLLLHSSLSSLYIKKIWLHLKQPNSVFPKTELGCFTVTMVSQSNDKNLGFYAMDQFYDY